MFECLCRSVRVAGRRETNPYLKRRERAKHVAGGLDGWQSPRADHRQRRSPGAVQETLYDILLG